MSDCIGIFSKCSRIVNQKTRFGEKTLVNVHITDGRETAVLSLWGPHAAKFQAESESLIQLGTNAPVILLFTGVTVTIFNNGLALQCSSVCRWYINPLLPETTLLQQSCGAAVGPPQRIGEERRGDPKTTTVKDLSLLKNPLEVEGNKYVVVAKIKRTPARAALVVHGVHHMQKRYGVRRTTLHLQEHRLQ